MVRLGSLAVLVMLVAGCLGSDAPVASGPKCGPRQVIDVSSSRPLTQTTSAEVVVTQGDGDRTFTFTISAHDVCDGQEVPYTVSAGILGEIAGGGCRSPVVQLQEGPGGVIGSMRTRPYGEAGQEFFQVGNASVFQFKEPASFTLSISVIYRVLDNSPSERKCQEDRIDKLAMHASYLTSLGAVTPSVRCGARATMTLDWSGLPEEENRSIEGNRRAYSWLTGDPTACGLVPLDYTVDVVLRVPAADDECKVASPKVYIREDPGNGAGFVELDPRPAGDGMARYHHAGSIDLFQTQNDVMTWYIIVKLTLLNNIAVNVFADDCANAMIESIRIEGEYADSLH